MAILRYHLVVRLDENQRRKDVPCEVLVELPIVAHEFDLESELKVMQMQ